MFRKQIPHKQQELKLMLLNHLIVMLSVRMNLERRLPMLRRKALLQNNNPYRKDRVLENLCAVQTVEHFTPLLMTSAQLADTI